jgi:putative ABC transport system ATP-binding protein
VAENNITCLMITHNIASALELGNRTILMRNGNIALELDDSQRKGMTVEDLLSVFRNQGLDNDRILFSAE